MNTALLNACKTNQHHGCRGHMVNTITSHKTGDTDTRYTTCNCTCHNTQPTRCLRCNSAEHDLATGYCIDTDACDAELERTLNSSELYQQLRAIRAKVRAERAEQEQPTRTTRPTTGRCEHCGAPTRGGRFVAGHDAKLKGELKRAAEAGDIDALLELHVRNWPTHTIKVDPATMTESLRILDTLPQGWLEQRTATRLEQ